MASFDKWMMFIKAVLISTGVAALTLSLKISIPVAIDFSVSRAPILWNSLLSWMKPPYLYFITNGIIITIAASSRLYRSSVQCDGEDGEIVSSCGKIQTEQIFHQAPPRQMVVMALDPVGDFGIETISLMSHVDDAAESAATASAVVYEVDPHEEDELSRKPAMAESLDLAVDSRDEIVEPPLKVKSPENTSENLIPAEKPLVSAKFGHRKLVKSNPKGGGARASRKPKRHETLENTWNMITEGKSMPLTKHFNKCDTWQNQGRENSNFGELKKSETFRDRTNYYQSPEKIRTPVRLKKEPSLSQDELNRRVEAFIKKFNEDMRLQRLESLKQDKRMVSRGI